MKKIVIAFNYDWVLFHREDENAPSAVFENELIKEGATEIENSSATELSFAFGEAEGAKARIREIFGRMYPGEDISLALTVEVDDIPEKLVDDTVENKLAAIWDLLSGESEGPSRAAPASKPAAATALSKIDGLVGAAEFKALAHEVAAVLPEMGKNTDSFVARNYLFSIGEGCGITTYAGLFAQLVDECGVKLASKEVKEVFLEQFSQGEEPFDDIFGRIERTLSGYVNMLCVDISEWMDKTDSREFRSFLRVAEKYADRAIVIFRVPFLDKDVLERVKDSLADVVCVKAVSFPPFSMNELRRYAAAELDARGYSVQPGAWKYIERRLAEEKSDGRFYGLNTVKKVVRELVYEKCAAAAKSHKNSNAVTAADAKRICAGAAEVRLSGMEQLESLVGIDDVKRQIKEIVAQIVSAAGMSASERPAIHMRFVGNPGTGKTTVARIVGKILKEKGILSEGNFFECSGLDLCGRYVGETAPKTAGICRDAYGSVLFIDEAYSLYREDGFMGRSYGTEAIDTLIAQMENHRDDFVVIMAGYPDEMQKLMEANAGLAGRMPYTVTFGNFTRGQLYEIFAKLVKRNFAYSQEVLALAEQYFNALPEEVLSAKDFGNARFARNLFERTWAKAAMRAQLEGAAQVKLTAEDFRAASAEKEFAATKVPGKIRIGF